MGAVPDAVKERWKAKVLTELNMQKFVLAANKLRQPPFTMFVIARDQVAVFRWDRSKPLQTEEGGDFGRLFSECMLFASGSSAVEGPGIALIVGEGDFDPLRFHIDEKGEASKLNE